MNYSLGAAGASDFSDEGKKSKKLKNKKKKNKDRERSRSMEPISPPPTKKRRSEKNDRTSPGSLSPVSEEDTYTGLQTKPKKVRCLSKLGASLEIYKSFLVEYIFNIEPIALFSLKRQAKNKNRSKTRLRNPKTLIEFPDSPLSTPVIFICGQKSASMEESGFPSSPPLATHCLGTSKLFGSGRK